MRPSLKYSIYVNYSFKSYIKSIKREFVDLSLNRSNHVNQF